MQDRPSPAARLQAVVMGVSGTGKTTVGLLLAAELGVEFADADEFHNPANVAKMASGTTLTDDDRWPWLEAIGRWLDERRGTGAVASCSALKRSYRDVLRRHAPDVWFLHLTGTPDLVTSRVSDRPHHFMPASLVGSQFETLEPPGPDEQAIAGDISLAPAEIVADFLTAVSGRPFASSGE